MAVAAPAIICARGRCAWPSMCPSEGRCYATGPATADNSQQAISLAPVPPRPKRRRGPHTRESVVADIRALALELGRCPIRADDNALAQRACRFAGGWGDAVEAAGLPRPSKGSRIGTPLPHGYYRGEPDPVVSPTPDIEPDIPAVEIAESPMPEPIVLSITPDIDEPEALPPRTSDVPATDVRAIAEQAFTGILDALRNQLTVGHIGVCPACDQPFHHDQAVTLVPLGPGADPGTRERARRGDTYSARAIPVHRACATGQTS